MAKISFGGVRRGRIFFELQTFRKILKKIVIVVWQVEGFVLQIPGGKMTLLYPRPRPSGHFEFRFRVDIFGMIIIFY